MKIGYFSQETLSSLQESASILQNVMRSSILPEHLARTILFRMGFAARDLHKEVCILSGGERARVVLSILLCGDYNVLLLDEPGNHLDLTALEALEEMLSLYQGTLLMVSHDRRLIDRVAQRLIVFEEGALREFEGNLADYERERNREDDARIEIEKLRMRMAEVISRISAPRKGDDKMRLEAEFDALARQLREMEKKT